MNLISSIELPTPKQCDATDDDSSIEVDKQIKLTVEIYK